MVRVQVQPEVSANAGSHIDKTISVDWTGTVQNHLVTSQVDHGMAVELLITRGSNGSTTFHTLLVNKASGIGVGIFASTRWEVAAILAIFAEQAKTTAA